MPYNIHTILTDNGIQFINQTRPKYAFKYIFDRVCEENHIEHRLTKISHPRTNGQVERMNRTPKDTIVKNKCHINNLKFIPIASLWLMKRLKALKGLTPCEFICNQWTKSPELFILPSFFGTVYLKSSFLYFSNKN